LWRNFLSDEQLTSVAVIGIDFDIWSDNQTKAFDEPFSEETAKMYRITMWILKVDGYIINCSMTIRVGCCHGMP
jgi:hypothetical protein